MTHPHRLSRRLRNLHPSPIREILSVIDRPGMISFAGGLPSPASFPRLDTGDLPNHWLQYGPSEGEPSLRQRVAEELCTLGLNCSPDQVLILSGSQQGIDLVGKLFIDAGTPVLVESPTYLAALQVFRFYGARFVACDLRHSDAIARDPQPPAFAYVIPTFQNPTGYCYSAAEREALARRCDEGSIPLFEDDPYRDLVYDACERTPVCTHLRHAPWIYQGSFSKTFAPGLRLGYLAASAELIPYLTRLKQAADLHSNRVSQWLVLNQLLDPARAQRMAALVSSYRGKRDTFAALLERYFGHRAQWEVPRGGLFFWLKLKRPADTRALLPLAIEQGVAFMPGEPFFPGSDPPGGALRLNFSHASEDQADRGLRSLARLLDRDAVAAAARPPHEEPGAGAARAHPG